MEQHIKKQVMIGFIVVCFVVAGAITLTARSCGSSGRGAMSREKIWVICRNPDCQAARQIEYEDYFDCIAKQLPHYPDGTPPLPCEQCAEPSVYEAIKCKKCELVFEPGAVPNDIKDRCPNCRYSKREEERKQREARGSGK
ncbi:MAG: hypothetical protein ACYSUC_02485 [Planctomycetota bacterium]|jgi:hypothetical protein